MVLAYKAMTGAALGERMQWFERDGQAVLWNAFMRYANTHPEVIETLPDSAHIVLIPEYSLLDEQDGLFHYLTLHGCAAYESMAYVHLALEELTFGELTTRPSVTGAHVEIPVASAPIVPTAPIVAASTLLSEHVSLN
jgi:hypothetical protein